MIGRQLLQTYPAIKTFIDGAYTHCIVLAGMQHRNTLGQLGYTPQN
jgi:hypothetical protein